MKTSFFQQTRTRLNAELQRLFASGLRTQINAEMPEWIQLAPYGEWPTSERDANGKPEGVQVFTRDDAASLVKRFNAWHRRLGRLARINSCKAYVGHPDFAPDIWPKRVELGDVVELSDDEHGLNGRMRWNSDADELLKKNPFPSVAWDTDVFEPGRERPVMLWSVGMTAKPNIKGVRSAINACPENEPEPENNEPPMIHKIKKALIDAGLCNEDDSDDVIQTHVGSMISQIGQQKQWAAQEKARADKLRTALNSEVPDADALIEATITRINDATSAEASFKERINALEAERDEARAARLNAVLDRLVETGRLSKAEAEAEGEGTVRARFNADFEKTLAEMNSKETRLNTKGLNLGHEKPALMEAHERTARLNAWVTDYMTRKNCDHGSAWEASKSDPEMKKLHQAMQDADKQRAAALQDA